MPDYRKQAKQFINAGYSVIPVNSTKNPSIPKWGLYQVRVMKDEEIERYFKDCYGIALLCGGPWRVVGLDFDLKYDLTGTLWDRYKKEIPKEILEKMYVQTTKNKGFHMAFKAPSEKLVGNEKLAARGTTAYERDETYREAFNDPETRDKATKIADKDRSRVLIETRSGSNKAAGGYIVISPTEGYKKVFGKKINEITSEEYDVLFDVARSFNEVKHLENRDKNFSYNEDWEVSPFEHYNQEGDVVEILVENGWKIIGQNAKSVRFIRPGQVTSKSSALFDLEKRIFSCFSTSCEFDVTKSYNPVGVFNLLECDNDFSECYKKLVNLEYGIK